MYGTLAKMGKYVKVEMAEKRAIDGMCTGIYVCEGLGPHDEVAGFDGAEDQDDESAHHHRRQGHLCPARSCANTHTHTRPAGMCACARACT